MLSNTLYIDFVTMIKDEPTYIRIFETNDHLFVFVNQNTEQNVRFDSSLDLIISKAKLRRKKRKTIFCNCAAKEMVYEIGEIVNRQLRKFNRI